MEMKWILVVIDLVYFWQVNAYFGWNFNPKSTAELLADGVCMVLSALVVLGFILEE